MIVILQTFLFWVPALTFRGNFAGMGITVEYERETRKHADLSDASKPLEDLKKRPLQWNGKVDRTVSLRNCQKIDVGNLW